MKRKRLLMTFLFYLVVALLLIYTVLPFCWAISTSLKVGSALYSTALWPAAPSLANYRDVFSEQPFLRNVLNSLVVATLTVGISMLLGVFMAYALARLPLRGRAVLLYAVLAVAMFPQIAVLTGLFELLRTLHLYNTYAGLALTYLIFTLPFTVWMLTAFIRELPRGLEEAAVVDGASPLRVVTRVVLPLLGPALVTAALLAFIAAWNEFLFALTFTLSNQTRTVPVAIAMLSGASQFELPFGHIMAASVVVTAPLILLVLLLQRRIIAGLTAGAIKG